MDLMERTYDVLIASDAPKATEVLTALLAKDRYGRERVVKSIGAAQRAWNERPYDLVIINAPLPDGMGTRFAIDVSSSSEAVVLVLAKSDICRDIREKVCDYGVYTLGKPTSEAMLSRALDWMASTRERLRAIGKITLSFEEKMAEIKLVNRAKWLLISDLGIDESQAHRLIEKRAMDRCISRGEVAEEIIRDHR